MMASFHGRFLKCVDLFSFLKYINISTWYTCIAIFDSLLLAFCVIYFNFIAVSI